jgi:hypothetical protein
MFSRDVLNALWPDGSFWVPVSGDDYDLFMDGIAANTEAIRADLDALRTLRDPARTPILSDLERELGVIPLLVATEEERRERLALAMFRRAEQPTYELLEEKLRASGFDVYVHANSPAVDPAIFLAQAFNMVCGDLLPGGNDAQCGEAEAICAQVGGELLVNGEFFEQEPNYTCLCDEPLAQCGEADALCGQYDSIRLFLIEYEIPTIAGYWPLIFFVGGAATRDPVTGEITDIEIAPIPTGRRLEFRRIILRHKPMCSWAGLIVVYQ